MRHVESLSPEERVERYPSPEERRTKPQKVTSWHLSDLFTNGYVDKAARAMYRINEKGRRIVSERIRLSHRGKILFENGRLPEEDVVDISSEFITDNLSDMESEVTRRLISVSPGSCSISEALGLLHTVFSIPRGMEARERQVMATVISRNRTFARLVKERADYQCEICGIEGFTQENGERYAEAHHVMELAKTRIDIPEVMICVCPTCHRVLHYGDDEALKARFDLNRRCH